MMYMANTNVLLRFSLIEIEELNLLTPLSVAGAILARNGFKLPSFSDEWLHAMADTANASTESSVKAALEAIKAHHPAFS
jgi:hypothetical protein